MTSETVIRDRWFPLFLGLLVTPILGSVAWAYTRAGDGSYWPATIFFPWAMFLAVIYKYITSTVFLLALVQWPIYGLMLNPGIANFRKKIIVLVACHGLMVVLTLLIDTDQLLS